MVFPSAKATWPKPKPRSTLNLLAQNLFFKATQKKKIAAVPVPRAIPRNETSCWRKFVRPGKLSKGSCADHSGYRGLKTFTDFGGSRNPGGASGICRHSRARRCPMVESQRWSDLG